LWSTVPGKRRLLHSRTLIACPIPLRSVAGRTTWTPPNQPFPFSAKRSPASFIGWRAVTLMKLLGHTSPEMTMQYLDVALTDLQREFELARSKPRHRLPQPRVPSAPLRAGLGGVLDSLLAAQHTLEMFRRALPNGSPRRHLDRLSNRLTKILNEARKLATP
jgi:hypothetical protein